MTHAGFGEVLPSMRVQMVLRQCVHIFVCEDREPLQNCENVCISDGDRCKPNFEQ